MNISPDPLRGLSELSRTGSLHVIACAISFSMLLYAGRPGVAGQVSDGHSPLAGATVTISDLLDANRPPIVVMTDQNGAFAVPEILDGDYSIQVDNVGFASVRVWPITIQFPGSYRRDFSLDQRPFPEGDMLALDTLAEIVGRLESRQQAISGASVCLVGGTLVGPECVVTNGLGQYYIHVQPGVYEAVVALAGQVIWRQKIDVTHAITYRDVIKPHGGARSTERQP